MEGQAEVEAERAPAGQAEQTAQTDQAEQTDQADQAEQTMEREQAEQTAQTTDDTGGASPNPTRSLQTI